MPVSGKGPAPREVPFALLSDTPDAEAEGKAVAEYLNQFASFGQGLLAARPAAVASNEGHIYWATNDTTWGPEGTWWISYGAAWHMFPPPTVTTAMIAAAAITNAKLANESIAEANLLAALLGPVANKFGLRKLGEGAIEAAPGNDIRIVAPTSGVPDVMQQGVLTTKDFNGSVNCNASGEISFAVEEGDSAIWLPSGSTLIRARSLAAEGLHALGKPPSTPASGKFMCIGLEVKPPTTWGGAVTFVLKSGAEKATQAEAETNASSPAVTAGNVRIWDIIMTNTAGVFSRVATAFGSTIQRRRMPWARGAYSVLRRTSGTITVASGSAAQLIDATGLALRVECTGIPLRIRVRGVMEGASGIGFGIRMDGAAVNGTADAGLWEEIGPATAGNTQPYDFSYEFEPAAGSHLFQPTVKKSSIEEKPKLLSTAEHPLLFSVEELRPATTNGTV